MVVGQLSGLVLEQVPGQVLKPVLEQVPGQALEPVLGLLSEQVLVAGGLASRPLWAGDVVRERGSLL